jgi:hypothetical protein
LWDVAPGWRLALDLGQQTVRSAQGAEVRARFVEIGTIYSPSKSQDWALGLIRSTDNDKPAAATRTLPPEAAKDEAALIERLAQIPDAALVWADLAQHLGLRARKGKAVNLDPAALLMDMLFKVDETAAQVVNR